MSVSSPSRFRSPSRRSGDAVLAAEARVRLVEEADPVRAARRRGERLRVERERRVGRDLRRHVDPGRVERAPRVEGARARDPVLDLWLACARRRQARVVERDACVDDADRDAAAVPRRMVVHELRRSSVLGRHVRVDPWRPRSRYGLRDDADDAFRPRIRHLDRLVDVEGQHRAEVRGRLDPVERDVGPEVAEGVVAIADARPEQLELASGIAGRARLRRHHHGHRSLALGSCVCYEPVVMLAQLAHTARLADGR